MHVLVPTWAYLHKVQFGVRKVRNQRELCWCIELMQKNTSKKEDVKPTEAVKQQVMMQTNMEEKIEDTLQNPIALDKNPEEMRHYLINTLKNWSIEKHCWMKLFQKEISCRKSLIPWTRKLLLYGDFQCLIEVMKTFQKLPYPNYDQYTHLDMASKKIQLAKYPTS